MRLRSKVAIVTGGANGIGRAISILFSKEGAKVAVADRDSFGGEACAAEIRAHGGDALFVPTDVGTDSDVEELIRAVVDWFGGIDILVNNAGVDIRGSVVETEPERWQRAMDVNLASVYRCCRFAIPEMIRRGGGAIVNVASIQGLYGWPNYAAYSASKAGIIGLTRQIAVEYGRSNIRSNAISPGAIVTELGANTRRLEPVFGSDPASSHVPSGSAVSSRSLRQGTPEDVALVALFLAGPESGHVSGQNLIVDGGDTASIV